MTACTRLQKNVKLYFSMVLPSSQRCTKKRCRSRELSMNTWLQYWTVGSIASKSPGDLQKLLHHESRITNLASGSFWLLRKQTFSPGGYELVYDSPQARLDRERLRLVAFWQVQLQPSCGCCSIGPFDGRPFPPLDRCECLLWWTPNRHFLQKRMVSSLGQTTGTR